MPYPIRPANLTAGNPGGRVRRARSSSAPLTPAAELVGLLVTYSPRDASGKRGTARYGTVVKYDETARTLTVEVQVPANPWDCPTGLRTVTLPLSAGPFRPV